MFQIQQRFHIWNLHLASSSLISTLVVNPQSLRNALANFNVESQKWFCRWNKLLKIRTSILLDPSLSSTLISLESKHLFKQRNLDDKSFWILIMLYNVDIQIRNCLKLSNSWAVSCLFLESVISGSMTGMMLMRIWLSSLSRPSIVITIIVTCHSWSL